MKKQGKVHPGGRLFWGGLKDFADGSLGSRTALMQQPYTDDPTTRGIRLSPYAELQELVQQADATGLQVNVFFWLKTTDERHPLQLLGVLLSSGILAPRTTPPSCKL